jgi:hypothetical protein
MTISMIETNVDMSKVWFYQRDLVKFKIKTQPSWKICAIVTRSLLPEYRHDIILKSFAILNQKNWFRTYYHRRRNTTF